MREYIKISIHENEILHATIFSCMKPFVRLPFFKFKNTGHWHCSNPLSVNYGQMSTWISPETLKLSTTVNDPCLQTTLSSQVCRVIFYISLGIMHENTKFPWIQMKLSCMKFSYHAFFTYWTFLCGGQLPLFKFKKTEHWHRSNPRSVTYGQMSAWISPGIRKLFTTVNDPCFQTTLNR